MEKAVVLDTKHDWMLEFEFATPLENIILLGMENCKISGTAKSHVYFNAYPVSGKVPEGYTGNTGYGGVRFEPDENVGAGFTVPFNDCLAFMDALNEKNRWRIGYEMSTDTITVSMYNKTTRTWDIMGSKGNIADFTLTADCLFGDYDGSNKYNMIGTVDYFDVIIEDSKQETDCLYAWEFDKEYEGKKFVSSSASNTLTIPSTTQYTLSNSEYIVAADKQPELKLEKSIKLDSTHDWYIEWRSAFNQGTTNCVLLGTDNSQSKYNFIYAAPGTNFGAGKVGAVRVNDAAGVEKYLGYIDGAENVTASANLGKAWNTWRLQYDCETKKLSLLMLNTTTHTWDTWDSVIWDNFSFEFTHVFGDFGSSKYGDNWVNFRGSIDYLIVSYAK